MKILSKLFCFLLVLHLAYEEDIYIVAGRTGTGKSALINRIAGYVATAEGKHQSITSEMKWIKIEKRGIIEFNNSIFIDTPGFSDLRGYKLNATELFLELMNGTKNANFKFILCYSAKDTRQHIVDGMNNMKLLFGQAIAKSALVVVTFPREKERSDLSALHQHIIDELNYNVKVVDFDSKNPLKNQNYKLKATLAALPSYTWELLHKARDKINTKATQLYLSPSNWDNKTVNYTTTTHHNETCYKVIDLRKTCFREEYKETTVWDEYYETCKEMGHMRQCLRKTRLLFTFVSCNYYEDYTYEDSKYPCKQRRPRTYSFTATYPYPCKEKVRQPYVCEQLRYTINQRNEGHCKNSDMQYWENEAWKLLSKNIRLSDFE